HCQWSCKESCLDLLLHVKPGGDRVGPFVVEGLLKDSVQSDSLKLPLTLSCQVCGHLSSVLSVERMSRHSRSIQVLMNKREHQLAM
nr:metallo-hydrolase/oxidoreductase superfamily protein [Tanacetum cinerariifolium]